jgi:hypothetical protein
VHFSRWKYALIVNRREFWRAQFEMQLVHYKNSFGIVAQISCLWRKEREQNATNARCHDDMLTLCRYSRLRFDEDQTRNFRFAS